jgi:hypothetical protein
VNGTGSKRSKAKKGLMTWKNSQRSLRSIHHKRVKRRKKYQVLLSPHPTGTLEFLMPGPTAVFARFCGKAATGADATRRLPSFWGPFAPSKHDYPYITAKKAVRTIPHVPFASARRITAC